MGRQILTTLLALHKVRLLTKPYPRLSYEPILHSQSLFASKTGVSTKWHLAGPRIGESPALDHSAP